MNYVDVFFTAWVCFFFGGFIFLYYSIKKEKDTCTVVGIVLISILVFIMSIYITKFSDTYMRSTQYAEVTDRIYRDSYMRYKAINKDEIERAKRLKYIIEQDVSYLKRINVPDNSCSYHNSLIELLNTFAVGIDMKIQNVDCDSFYNDYVPTKIKEFASEKQQFQNTNLIFFNYENSKK